MYNPIGLISLAHLLRTLLYRETFDLKPPWDENLPPLVKQKWERWKLDISNNRVNFPRSIPTKLESVTVIDIQVFGDIIILGCCAAAYRVVHQSSNINQNLIASKSILSKYEITIPCLELTAALMSAKLGTNVSEILKNFNVRLRLAGVIALWYVSGWARERERQKGNYKVFVANKIKKILWLIIRAGKRVSGRFREERLYHR